MDTNIVQFVTLRKAHQIIDLYVKDLSGDTYSYHCPSSKLMTVLCGKDVKHIFQYGSLIDDDVEDWRKTGF